MVLIFTLVGTLTAGVGSVLLAALLSPSTTGRHSKHLLSFAAGALLSTALVHLMPEALEGEVTSKNLMLALLCGLVFFFLLDKAELWHHGHEHHQDSMPDGHDHAAPGSPAGGWAVLVGDSIHCFGDGLLISAAFVADVKLGALASLAVLTHEIPHHLGDLAVLRQAKSNKRLAVVKVSLAGAVTTFGGVMGFWLVESLKPWLPYFLTAAAASFIYVALADLIPQLQKHEGKKSTVTQVLCLAAGIAIVAAVSSFDVA